MHNLSGCDSLCLVGPAVVCSAWMVLMLKGMGTRAGDPDDPYDPRAAPGQATADPRRTSVKPIRREGLSADINVISRPGKAAQLNLSPRTPYANISRRLRKIPLTFLLPVEPSLQHSPTTFTL